jgi:hypothetical protein
MKLKKFNEMYSDKDYDYSKTNEPITLDTIKEHIKVELSELEVDNPNLERDVDMLAQRIMYSFWDKLTYMGENYEGDLENISNGSFR